MLFYSEFSNVISFLLMPYYFLKQGGCKTSSVL